MVDYKDGQRVEEKTFYEDGQIESHKFYKKAWNYKITEYYQNGKTRFEFNETESKSKSDKLLTDIDYKYFYDSGKLSETGRKLRGLDLWGGDVVYNDKGVLLSVRVIERKSEKQVKKVDYFPDGSSKSEIVDPDYEKKLKSLKK